MPVPLLVPIGALIVQGVTWVFRNRIASFIASALLWMGISWGTQKVVMGPVLDGVTGYITNMSGASGLGAIAFNWIGVLQFDVAVTMILSAVSTRMAVQGAKVFMKKA